MFKKIQNDKGALIVEASIVFPVSFLVIFLMLFMGNAYLQKARVEAIVSRATIEGAARCADPMMEYIEEKGKIPPLGEVSIEPYRYIVGTIGSFAGTGAKFGMGDIQDSIKEQIRKEMQNMNPGLFDGMQPQEYYSAVNVEYDSYFVASYFTVSVNYKIVFPIRLLGQTEKMSLKFASYCKVPVSDTPEFIRNVNMAEDLLESTGALAKMQEMVNGMSNAITKLTKK